MVLVEGPFLRKCSANASRCRSALARCTWPAPWIMLCIYEVPYYIKYMQISSSFFLIIISIMRTGLATGWPVKPRLLHAHWGDVLQAAGATVPGTHAHVPRTDPDRGRRRPGTLLPDVQSTCLVVRSMRLSPAAAPLCEQPRRGRSSRLDRQVYVCATWRKHVPTLLVYRHS